MASSVTKCFVELNNGSKVSLTRHEIVQYLSKYGYVTEAYPRESGNIEGWLSKEESTIESRRKGQYRIHYFTNNVLECYFTFYPSYYNSSKLLSEVLPSYFKNAHGFDSMNMKIHRGTKETPLLSLGGEFLPFGYDDVREYLEQYGVVSNGKLAVDPDGTLANVTWVDSHKVTLPGGTIGKFFSECVDKSWVWVFWPNYVGCAPYCMDRIVEGWVKQDDDLLEKSHKDKSRGQSQRKVCPSAEGSRD